MRNLPYWFPRYVSQTRRKVAMHIVVLEPLGYGAPKELRTLPFFVRRSHVWPRLAYFLGMRMSPNFEEVCEVGFSLVSRNMPMGIDNFGLPCELQECFHFLAHWPARSNSGTPCFLVQLPDCPQVRTARGCFFVSFFLMASRKKLWSWCCSKYSPSPPGLGQSADSAPPDSVAWLRHKHVAATRT